MATKGAVLLLFFFIFTCLLFHTDASRTIKTIETTGGGDGGTAQAATGNGDEYGTSQGAIGNGDGTAQAATGNGDEYGTSQGATGNGVTPHAPTGNNGRNSYCGGQWGWNFCSRSHQETISTSYTSAVIAIASVVILGIA